MWVEGDAWQVAVLHVCVICASLGGAAGAACSEGTHWQWLAAVLAGAVPAVPLCGAQCLPGLSPACGCLAVPAWVALQCPRHVSESGHQLTTYESASEL